MNQTLGMLKDIVGQQTALYQKLLLFASQKTNVLIEGDTDALDAIVKREEAALKKLSSLESARENLTREYAREHAMAAAGLTLADIAGKAEQTDRDELTALGRELKTVLAAIADINVQNRALIDTHLKYSAFCVEVLTGQMDTAGMYTNTGNAKEEKTRKHMLFDQQA